MRDFNLLPEYVIIQKRNSQTEKLFITIGATVIGILLALTGYWFVMAQLYQHKVDLLLSKTSEIQYVVAQKENLDNMEKDMTSKRNAKKFIEDQDKIIMNNLNLIEQVLNKDITITNINLDVKLLTVDCKAKDKETVAIFLNKLRNDTNFNSAVFIREIGEEGGSTGKDKSRNFRIELKVK